MINKEHPIQRLEEALKIEEERVDSYQKTIKAMKDQTTKYDASIIEITERISGLKDALHKLKGLDNLEKKNIEERRPASMEKNLLRTETAMLYGRSIGSYSKRELAAYIIHQSDKIIKILEAKK